MTYQIKVNQLGVQFRTTKNNEPSLKKAMLDLVKFKKQKNSTFIALKNINLEINDNDRIGIIGRNGAGKSTLLRCLAGIYPPSSGTVEVQGNIVPLLEFGVGLEPNRTVSDNIYLNGAFLGLSKSDVQDRMQDILDFSELTKFKNERLDNLSSGMRSRLSFSIFTTISPDILLLDEVFAAGDAAFIKKARERMLKIVDQCKILAMVSHQERNIREICNRAIVLNNGLILYDGNVEDAFSFYKEEII